MVVTDGSTSPFVAHLAAENSIHDPQAGSNSPAATTAVSMCRMREGGFPIFHDTSFRSTE